MLNQLHDEHVQTLNDLSQISAEYHTLRAKYEMEDDQALEAQQRAYSNGDDATKLPKRTPQGTRTTRLNELMERGKVVQAHLRELVNRIVSTVIQHELDWTDELRQGEYRANEQVKELKAQLAEAQEVAEHTPDLRTWLERTAKNRTGDHLHFGWFSSKPTTDLLTISNEGRSRSTPYRATLYSLRSRAVVSTRSIPARQPNTTTKRSTTPATSTSTSWTSSCVTTPGSGVWVARRQAECKR